MVRKGRRKSTAPPALLETPNPGNILAVSAGLGVLVQCKNMATGSSAINLEARTNEEEVLVQRD